MSDVSYAAGRTPLELGALVALATLAIAAVLGTVAVLTADEVASSFGRGLGVAVAIFLTGATLACALACLAREQLTLVSLSSILVAGLAIDLLVLAIVLDIESDAYGKVVGVAFVWSFFALVALGLTVAVGETRRLARSLYVGAVGMCVLAGLTSSWLVVTSGDDSDVVLIPDTGTAFGVPTDTLVGDDDLLRALGASLVLLAALWFGALAASRLERGPEPPAAT
jgi:hypothetical protein